MSQINKHKRAAFLGSFDGLTLGHQWIIENAASQYDELVVGLGINPEKKYTFSLSERLNYARDIFAHLPNVKVLAYRGMFTDFLAEQNVDVLLRGLRSGREYDDQIVMELYAWSQRSRIKILASYIPSPPDESYKSSSLVKAVLKEQGDASAMAPPQTIAGTMARAFSQYPYIVTGMSGAGKSHICREFKKLADEYCIPVLHIDVDQIAHAIHEHQMEPLYVKVRTQIRETFGDKVMNEDGSVNRRVLGPIVFGDPEKLTALNRIMGEPISILLRKKLYGQKGLLLIDSALAVEAEMLHLANYNAMLVRAGQRDIAARLDQRSGLDEAQVKRRATSQLTTDKKQDALQGIINEKGYGSIQLIQNDKHLIHKDMLIAFDAMLKEIDLFGELRIKGFFKRIGAADPDKAYDFVRTCYSSDDRFYHALSHIVDGLNIIPAIADHLENPDAFILAWIFHDIIYHTRAEDLAGQKSNEERSANVMEKLAREWGVNESTIHAARSMVLATQHGKVEPETNDEKYLVDLDMSILGRSPKKFQWYENAVRAEFGHVLDKDWIVGRRHFVESVKNFQFHTDYFRIAYQAQTDRNIAASHKALSCPAPAS